MDRNALALVALLTVRWYIGGENDVDEVDDERDVDRSGDIEGNVVGVAIDADDVNDGGVDDSDCTKSLPGSRGRCDLIAIKQHSSYQHQILDRRYQQHQHQQQ
jgi:hypothetical protein